MPGIREAVRGGVPEKDERSGTIVLVDAEGSYPVQGVRGGYGKHVVGGTNADTAWEGSRGDKELRNNGPWRGSATCRMSFLNIGGMRNCPVEVCPGRAATRKAMWVHFFHRNVRDTVIILEEGPPPPTQILYLDIKVLV